MWNYLVPNEFYIYIRRNDNFIALNKLSLKYQNAFVILNSFILEDNNNFLLLKEYFLKNAFLYHYIYPTLFPKHFCRVDDFGIKSKLAFEVAHAGYQNQQESLCFVQLPFKQEQTEIDEMVEVVKTTTTILPVLPALTTTQKSYKKKDRKC